MSTLELRHFESVPAGDGQVLLRLAGRWPHQGDAHDAPATLLVHSGGDTHELDALPAPGLSGDGGSRNVAFAAPEEMESHATRFELAVGELVFDLPACAPQRATKPRPAKLIREQTAGSSSARSRMPSVRVPSVRMPAVRMPAMRLGSLRLPGLQLPAVRTDRWDMDEVRVMATGCALGAACATAILVEIVP